MKATIYKGMNKVKQTSKDLRSPGASHSKVPSPLLGLKGQDDKVVAPRT